MNHKNIVAKVQKKLSSPKVIDLNDIPKEVSNFLEENFNHPEKGYWDTDGNIRVKYKDIVSDDVISVASISRLIPSSLTAAFLDKDELVLDIKKK